MSQILSCICYSLNRKANTCKIPAYYINITLKTRARTHKHTYTYFNSNITIRLMYVCTHKPITRIRKNDTHTFFVRINK